MTKIVRALAVLPLMTIVACARPSVAIAPESMDELHAAVLADANAAMSEALDDASRALPPMDANAEPELGAAGERAETSEAPSAEEVPPPKATEPEPSGASKAKAAPPLPAPSSSATTPPPTSPKAPAEMWNPSKDQRP